MTDPYLMINNIISDTENEIKYLNHLIKENQNDRKRFSLTRQNFWLGEIKAKQEILKSLRGVL
jgi:hypothetical protein